MQQKDPKVSFGQFLKYFPEIALPVTLTEDAVGAFSKQNKPLPLLASDTFISKFHKEGDDDFTEYVPCLRIPETHDFHAIIYWRAKLYEYGYYMATYNKKGLPVSHRRIAGTFQEARGILRMVATIDPDWIIYIVVGEADADEQEFNPLATKSFNLELLATGEIISS